MVVFHHEVLVEEPDGLLGGRGGEADKERIEVFQHLPPEIVDGTVAFVGDDEIERLDGNGGVVGDLLWAGIGGADLVSGEFVGVLREFLATQHGVEPLNGADGNAGNGVELVRGEVLDVVKLGELAPDLGRNELLELGCSLTTEIRAIYEKEDAARPGISLLTVEVL